MASNTLTTFIFVILFCQSTNGAGKIPYAFDSHDGVSSPFAGFGICKSIVETQGYACEEHMVTTKDGFILSMQRIPARRSGEKSDKPPVLLQHGLMLDAASWLVNSPDKSLPYILADNGYDVWLVSTRGTRYSRGHTSLVPLNPAYWDWSWDELAAYDLPASFQYVHDQTGQKLHYVGHSLGTLMALAALSKGNLVDMLRSAGLLCPIAYLNQIPTQFARVAANAFMGQAMYWLGLNEFIPGGQPAANFMQYICNRTHSNCSQLVPAFTGQSCCVNFATLYALPQPSSTKNLIHLSQMTRRLTIAMFDYGSIGENFRHFGQITPPEYNMASIPNDVPLFLAYGGRDVLADVNDVQTLIRALKGHDPDKLVLLYREEYSHADFVWGTNANQLVYDPLMDFFKLH